MNIVHLTASTFYGGPERQMLGLAQALGEEHATLLLSFAESGRCRGFLAEARRQGIEAAKLTHDTPRFRSAIREVADRLRQHKADVLCCHTYKANLLGRIAARRVGIPVVVVSRGWTGESFKVRLYEKLDRLHLRWVDQVVCVSDGQAEKVRQTGVRPERMRVIRNAVDPERFADPDPRCRTKLERFFREPPELIVGAAGRLSPEKGFDMLIQAVEHLAESHPSVGFVIFGEGPNRGQLLQQIRAAGLSAQCVLAGFRPDLDRFLPHLDLLVLPSYTEGLPNVVLEACAAGVPVVATNVGGTPEVIEDGVGGFLVPPGDPDSLAENIADVLALEDKRQELGFLGQQRVLEHFTFAAQGKQYLRLFEELCGSPKDPDEGASAEELVDELAGDERDHFITKEATCKR